MSNPEDKVWKLKTLLLARERDVLKVTVSRQASALKQAREALNVIAKRLEETAGGGRTTQSRRSLRKEALAAIDALETS